MKTVNELFTKVLKMTTDELYVQVPAEITKVSSDGNYVSAILHINDNDPDIEVHHIKVRHLESKRAYIYLGMKKGDFGVVRFFDRSTEAYLQSDYNYNSDDRQHSINDRCFELGFIPDKEAYVYRENVDIEIGLKGKSVKMSFTEDGIVINGAVTFKDDVTFEGKINSKSDTETIDIATHKHTDSLGGNTSTPQKKE